MEAKVKEKVECDLEKLKVRILAILNDPVSESDFTGSPIKIKDLIRLLDENFEYSSIELCKALSELSFSFDIRISFVPKDTGRGEGDICTIDEIIYGPGIKSIKQDNN